MEIPLVDPIKLRAYKKEQYIKRMQKPGERELNRKRCEKWWKTKGRDWNYKYLYGITEVEFNAKVASQNNRCPIGNHLFGSGLQWNAPALDHDHETGKNRDVLCRLHNASLGGFHDSVVELEVAIEYLKKYQGEKP